MSKVMAIIVLSVICVTACDSEQKTTQEVKEKLQNISSKNELTSTEVKSVELQQANDQQQIKPVEKVVEAKYEAPMNESSHSSMTGEQVYKKSCFSCHGTGVANAPKLGDVESWKSRISKGKDALYTSAVNGVPGTAMMARGTCAACSDDELKAAVDFMVSKVN